MISYQNKTYDKKIWLF